MLFGPEQGQTMVLVHAPDAAGAKVNNTVGLSVNKATLPLKLTIACW
jgi:outer membrane usher protein